MNKPSSNREDNWRAELRNTLKAKDRSTIPRVEMPELDPGFRNKNHQEVNTGLNEEMARQEASRCLDCKNPTCIEGCPVGIDIPGFIKGIEARRFDEAADILRQTNTLPSVCGRVCPQEVQCESKCIYHQKMSKDAVAIGYLERFIADYQRTNSVPPTVSKSRSEKQKVAVIGSGPAGLTAAGDLAKMGYRVTVFEALHEAGGVLKYGIPEFRLPNSIVDSEIQGLKNLGVEFITNVVIGKTFSIEDLKKEGYEAFFVGSGAGLPRFMHIPGENLNGILSSNEYLTRVNLMNAAKKEYDTPVVLGKRVAVIGGGNTAMDSVRTAKRLGAEKAMIIYRRSFEEMPARREEIKHAREEGIEFLNLHNPVKYLGDKNGRVKAVVLQKMELGEADSSGRRRPVPLPDSEFTLETDLVIVSVGVSPNPIIPQSMKELKVSQWGTIEVDTESLESNISGIFAGGDIVRGGATVILAMGDGRLAAKNIDNYLQSVSKQKNFKTIETQQSL